MVNITKKFENIFQMGDDTDNWEIEDSANIPPNDRGTFLGKVNNDFEFVF